MSKKLVIDLEALSDELNRSQKEVKEYQMFGDDEMAMMYKCRVDALLWVIKMGEEDAWTD